MEIKKNQTEEIEKQDLSPNSHREVRSEARRKLMKAGLMSVPVIMTVHSRPLFAQTIGSTEALSYGGHDTQNLEEPIADSPAQQNIFNSDNSNELFEDLTFTRKRDPRDR